MNIETVNLVLKIVNLKNQLDDLLLVLNYNTPIKITITNDTGISKSFDAEMIKDLKSYAYVRDKELDKKLEEL